MVIVSTDYYKAVDTVRHSSLASKLDRLDVPYHIHNWLINCFKNRGHITKYANEGSEVAFISASVVHGSVIGPTAYITGASDLHPLHSFNVLVKSADSYLLVGSPYLSTVLEKFNHIKNCAKDNLRLIETTSDLTLQKRGRFWYLKEVSLEAQFFRLFLGPIAWSL